MSEKQHFTTKVFLSVDELWPAYCFDIVDDGSEWRDLDTDDTFDVDGGTIQRWKTGMEIFHSIQKEIKDMLEGRND